MAENQYELQGGSSWDTKVLSTNFNPSRSIPNVSTIQMSPTTNYVVPYSKYNSSMSPQNFVDGRPMQQYPQSARLQSYPSQSFQPTQIKSTQAK